MRTQYFHTVDEYNKSGIEKYLEHCRNFLEGNGTRPVSRTENKLAPGKFVFFTFTVDLFNLLVKKNKKLLKSHEAAIKYGYSGESRGKRNGIILQKEKDEKMWRKTLSFVFKKWDEVCRVLGLCRYNFNDIVDELKLVKIVHHDPSGRRVVGVMYNNKIIFVGIASY